MSSMSHTPPWKGADDTSRALETVARAAPAVCGARTSTAFDVCRRRPRGPRRRRPECACGAVSVLLRVCGLWPSGLARDDDVVNLEDEADALGGEGDGRGVHEEGHQHILLEDVGHTPLAHVDARRLLSSVTTSMASRPAFSARVYGTTSIASAKARTQYWCMPSSVLAHLESL